MPFNQQDLDYVLNECRIKLIGAADSGIKQELWGVIKEFLQDSNTWIEHQKLLVTAGVQHYDVSPRDGGQIIRLFSVVDGNRLPVNATMSHLGRLDVHTRITISSIDTPPNTQSTNSTNPWHLCFSKNITFPATRDNIPVAPSFIMSVYSGTIVDGVLGKMMLQAGKSYSNQQLGTYHLRRFRDGIGIAKNDVWNENVFGGQRWRFPSTFSTHSQRGYGTTAWPSETF